MAVSRNPIPTEECPDCGFISLRPVKPSLIREPAPGSIRYAVVGEAPGEDEDIAGKPFIGRSGKMLKATLQAYGFNTDEILFTNAICCRPPNNRTPSKTEIDRSRSRLLRELREFKPDRILCVGSTAATAVLSLDGGHPQKITQMRGVWYDCPYLDAKVIATLHPAAILRAPSGFDTFSNDIDRLGRSTDPFQAPELILVNTWQEAKRAIDRYLVLQGSQDTGIRGIDIETTGFNPNNRDIICLGISPSLTTSVIFTEEAIKEKRIWGYLVKLLTDKKLQWSGHNAIQFDQFFIKGWLKRIFGISIDFEIKWDTMLMHYAVDERTGTHGLDKLAQYYFGIPSWEGKVHKYLDKTWGYRDCPRDLLYEYLGYDTAITWAMFPILRPMLDEGKLLSLYQEVFAPGAKMLSETKCYGVKIDVPYLEKLDVEWMAEVDRMRDVMIDIAEEFGFDHISDRFRIQPKDGKPPKPTGTILFNPGSYQHLQTLMYDIMKVPQVNLKAVASSSGDHADTMVSTADDVINWLVGFDDGGRHTQGQIEGVAGREREFKFLKQLQEFRRLAKLHSTYVVGLLEKVDENGYVYPDLLIHGTETGRLSSKNPNIQNIPKHDYEDRKKRGLVPFADAIRFAFIPRPGYKFVDIDYSQLEYRVCAWYCRDPGLIAAFNSGIDFHKAVAAKVYSVHPSDVTKNQRHSAKFVNFGIMYGRQAAALSRAELMWAFSETEPCTIPQAERFLRDFLDEFPKQEEFMLTIEKDVKELGYVESHYGRRRRFPFIPDKGALMKFQREARNMPIQGMASDICFKSAMRIHATFNPEELKVLFLIHDAVMMEVREDLVEEYVPKVIEIMENPPDLENVGFKFAVEAEVLDRWCLIEREDD